jgi:hypothetical protein
MGCIELQYQPGNCLECGIKLLTADERGSMLMMDYADKHGLDKKQINADKNISVNPCDNDSCKSAYESNNISVDQRNIDQYKSAYVCPFPQSLSPLML